MNQLQKNVDDIRRKMMPTKVVDAPSNASLVQTGAKRVTMSMQTYRYVLLIVAVFALYTYSIASERYATTSLLYVEAPGPSLGALGGSGGSFLPAALPGIQDAMYLKEYILSPDMLDLLDKELNVRAHFSSQEWDYLSRLSADASQEEFLAYYQDHINVNVTLESAIITLETQGFDKAFSENLNAAILRNSDSFINKVGQDIARQEVAFIESKLADVQEELVEAETAFLTFQNAEGVIDGTSEAENIQGQLNEIDNQLVEAQAELKINERFMSQESAAVVALKDRIAALQEQRQQIQSDRISGDSGTVNELGAQEQRLKLQVQFATDIYRGTLDTLAKKQIEASQKGKYLSIIQAPRLAEDAKYPKSLYNTATLFVLLSIAYGLGIMIIASVQEHRDV